MYICYLMIAFLSGKLFYKSPAVVVLDVNNVGYEVHISLHTYSRIEELTEVRLLTYMHVKEDGFTMYGFFDEEERSLFMHLISVSGVGAGTARMMLSSMKPDDIIAAIVNDQEKILESIKGIGAKSAKRIILELKDKLGKYRPKNTEMLAVVNNNLEADALQALVSLGIARSVAQQAIGKSVKLSPESDLQALIKMALKNI